MGKPSARSSSSRARSSISSFEPALRRWSVLVLLAALPPLGGCGFTPLYGERAGASTVNDLASIDISVPETKLGRSLKYDLFDRMTDSGTAPASPAYKLVLEPHSYSQDIAVQQNAAVTRANYVLVVPFRLTDASSGKTLYKSTSRSRSSYNRSLSEFANLTAAGDAEKRTTEAVADDIKRQLGVYFERQASAAPTPR